MTEHTPTPIPSGQIEMDGKTYMRDAKGATCTGSVWGRVLMNRPLQKLIHVGCRELGLDTEARHELQMRVTGKASLSDMTEDELTAVLERLKTDGFSPIGRGHNARRPSAPRADLRLIHVLWRKLAEAGEVRSPGRDGLNAFIRARFGRVWGSVPADVDMLRDWQKIDAVIQALKDWGQRAGIDFDWEGHRK